MPHLCPTSPLERLRLNGSFPREPALRQGSASSSAGRQTRLCSTDQRSSSRPRSKYFAGTRFGVTQRRSSTMLVGKQVIILARWQLMSSASRLRWVRSAHRPAHDLEIHGRLDQPLALQPPPTSSTLSVSLSNPGVNRMVMLLGAWPGDYWHATINLNGTEEQIARYPARSGDNVLR